MKKVVALGNIKDGVLTISNRRIFAHDLKTLSDGSVTIVVEREYKKRSNKQSRYYWGVVIPLCKRGFNDLGHDLNDEDTHTFLKSKFNSIPILFEDTGELFPLGRSTTEMDTIDFKIFIEKIQQFAAEILNTEIPDPIS